ncbi:MAG: hypothetical protein K2X35_16875 [Bryobacteraceae bacterium]|nr:hypothetical protein [Bryobacteraceae bacterium]
MMASFGAAGVAAAQGGAPDRPAVRRGHALAYHAGRKEVMLFGGEVAMPQARESELWGLRRGKWSLVNRTGPSPRTLGGFVYDARRDRLVVFAGLGGNNNRYADTWEWNGSAWEERFFNGPPAGPRDHMVMSYDEKRATSVVYGGAVLINDIQWKLDTWEYDGTAWSKRDGPTPGARAHHAMAYDSARNVTLLYGGFDDKNRYEPSLWQWDGTSWKLLSTEGPGVRARHRMAFDAARGEMVLYGGDTGNPRRGQFLIQGDTWTWDGARWTERKVEGPGPRFMHAMIYDADRKVVVLHGGTFNAKQDDTWEWDGKAWKPVA